MSLAHFFLVGSLARADARIGALAFDANQLFLFAGQASLSTAPFGKEDLQGVIALAVGIALPCLALPDFHARSAIIATAARSQCEARGLGDQEPFGFVPPWAS